MKFNKTVSNKTVNLAGGKAYKQTDKLEFVSILLTSFLKDQFYKSENDTAEKLVDLIGKLDKRFVAKTAVYARTKFGMRSVSHLVAGEIAKNVKGEQWTKNFFNKVVYRPDDMLEILSYYCFKYGKPIPNSLKKGLREAILKFDDYKLAKYRGEGKAVSMVDLVNLVHPKGTDTLKKLIKGELRSVDTWEAKLSKAGQESESDEELAEAKDKAWKDLILEKKIGYFALLRNLRNILEQSPEILDKALELLVDENLIKKSLVLPFRFTTALKAVEETSFDGVRKVIVALNKAVDFALSNVPKLKGRTLVVLDESGSMSGRPSEIGSLFTAVLVKACDADLITFAESARYQNLNSMDSTLTLTKSINFNGGGTNFHSIFQTANKPYDRIIILSDMQGWIGYNTPQAEFNAYKARTGADPKIYSFDLQGYGTMQFPEQNVYCLAGFSDKIFDIMKMLETDKNVLINEIDKINFN